MSRRRKALMLSGAMILPCLLMVASGPAASAASQSQCGNNVALITGSGSTWAQNAVQQWVSNENNQGVQVVFTGDGSAAGLYRLRAWHRRLRGQ